MEIFLGCIIILLIIIFFSSLSGKIKKLDANFNTLLKILHDAEDKKIKEQQLKKEEPPIVTPIVTPIVKEKPIAEPKITPPIITPPPIVEQLIINIEKPIEKISVEEKVVKQQPIFNATIPPPIKHNLIPHKTWWDNFKDNNPDLEKFVGENLIPKIGIAILVIGIGFFVKYAIDQNWINETARAGIGILAGAILLGVAHKMRSNFKAFSSILVAGAISTFYFTIAIAFHEYHLFSQTVAFAIMVVITAFSVFVSWQYNRLELAVLSLIGAFATPLMLSTGEGNYKILFTYILIVNVGMLMVSHIRQWKLVSVLAFIFTQLFYTIWFVSVFAFKENPPLKGAFAFATAFYVLYLSYTLLHHLKFKTLFKGIDYTILLSNSFIYFGFGINIFSHYTSIYNNTLKGVFATVLALINLVLAIIIKRRQPTDLRVMYIFIGLTLTFVTLIAPIQLKGNYITLFWAVESTLLIWLSVKSKLKGFYFSAYLLQFLATFSLIIDWVNVYSNYNHPALLSNKAFITGVFTVAAFVFNYFQLRKSNTVIETKFLKISYKLFSQTALILALVLFYGVLLIEGWYQAFEHIYFSESATYIPLTIHLLYTGALILISVKTNKSTIASFIMYVFNALLFMFLANILAKEELKLDVNFGEYERCYIAYLLHFINLVAMLLIAFKIHSCSLVNKNYFLSKSNFVHWLTLALTVIFISIECNLNWLFIVLQNTAQLVDDYTFYDVTIEHATKVGLPITWVLLAFSFLAYGIKKHLKTFRVGSLLLLAILLLKLFTYDINDVPKVGKIIAFLILGVVLLIMSFMYQKIKTIILENTSEETKIKNNDETKL